MFSDIQKYIYSLGNFICSYLVTWQLIYRLCCIYGVYLYLVTVDLYSHGHSNARARELAQKPARVCVGVCGSYRWHGNCYADFVEFMEYLYLVTVDLYSHGHSNARARELAQKRARVDVGVRPLFHDSISAVRCDAFLHPCTYWCLSCIILDVFSMLYSFSIVFPLCFKGLMFMWRAG